MRERGRERERSGSGSDNRSTVTSSPNTAIATATATATTKRMSANLLIVIGSCILLCLIFLWKEQNYHANIIIPITHHNIDRPPLVLSSTTTKSRTTTKSITTSNDNNTSFLSTSTSAAQNNVSTAAAAAAAAVADNNNNNNNNNNNIMNLRPHPHAGAVDEYGNYNYIADPTELRRGVALWQQNQQQPQPQQQNQNQTRYYYYYWDRLSTYHARARNGTFTSDYPLSSELVCHLPPGKSFEGEGGFKIITEKMRIRNNKNYAITTDNTTTDDTTTTTSSSSSSTPKLFCAIYTYPKMRDLARAQALTWGYKCDGYLAFSTETIRELGMVHLLHRGEESYQNMWQKVRSIWAYIARHYLQDYDFFHLGGDDLYVMVENMRHFLGTYHDNNNNNNNNNPLFFGIPISQPGPQGHNFVAGAPGYTINRAALRAFADRGIDTCAVKQVASHEDRIISRCLREIGIGTIQDTRDAETGEQQYIDCNPDHLYTSKHSTTSFHAKAAKYWETLPYPGANANANATHSNSRTGPKHELEAAAKYSITLHDIYHPIYVARIHALLFPSLCPPSSVLGRALRFYGIV